MEDKNDFIEKNNDFVCGKHKTSFVLKCPTCESERKEKLNKSYDKAVKLHDKALKKLSEN